jgi:hypothetical protein
MQVMPPVQASSDLEASRSRLARAKISRRSSASAGDQVTSFEYRATFLHYVRIRSAMLMTYSTLVTLYLAYVGVAGVQL